MPSTLIALAPLIIVLALGLGAAWAVHAHTRLPDPMPDADSPQALERPVQFTGQSGEYFWKWISVVCLNIITLGLYSPWGTVRLRTYLYGHTRVGPHALSFLGDPIAILKGRLVVVSILLVLVVLASAAPTLYAVALAGTYLVGLPLLMPRALRYQARTTALAQTPFSFSGSSKGAFVAYVVGPLGSLLSLGLLLPVFSRFAAYYRYNHLAWAGRPIAISVTLGQMYAALGWGLLAGLTSAGVVGAVAAALIADFGDDSEMMELIAIVPAVLFYFGLIPAALTYQTAKLRAVLDSLVVDGVGRMQCQLPASRTLFVSLTNLFAVICSLGLAAPWARIRSLRLITGALTFHAMPGILTLEAGAASQASLATDEITANLFNIEF
jgi:uncharacterized membrane protein YjgN (DUF898 family)